MKQALGNCAAFLVDCLNAKSRRSTWCTKAELNGNVDSENDHGGSPRTHVLHRTRCSQENDQLLRQGCERADSSRWQDRCNKTRTRHLDEDSPTALDGGDGSNDLHRLDLRSPIAACPADQGGTSADASCHCSGQKEERPDRCGQDRRLLALRFSARMPHGLDRDSRSTQNLAVSTAADAPDGADEESHLGPADGNGSQL